MCIDRPTTLKAATPPGTCDRPAVRPEALREAPPGALREAPPRAGLAAPLGAGPDAPPERRPEAPPERRPEAPPERRLEAPPEHRPDARLASRPEVRLPDTRPTSRPEVRLVPALPPVARAAAAETRPGVLPSPQRSPERREDREDRADRGEPEGRAPGERTSPTTTAAPHRRRPAAPEPPPGASQPAVERLGGSRVASYSHALPEQRSPAATAVHARPPNAGVGGAASLDPRQACCMVALAAVEVLGGSRPLAQLARWVTPEVYDSLARRAALTAPRARVLDPVAASTDVGPVDGVVRRPSVRRVRAFPVSDHVVEASVIITHADRVRAVAVRLTRASGRWRASALVVG
jgi:hypothetical protein